MPVMSSLGALSYTRLGAETSNNWYLQTDGSYPFIGLEIDPSNNIYVGGSSFLMQFTDLGPVPRQNWSYTLSSPALSETFVDFKYSSYYNAIGITYTETYASTQFPNPTQYRSMWSMIPSSGSIPSLGAGERGPQYNSGNYGIQSVTLAVNESDGTFYPIGWQSVFGSPGISIQCNRFSNATTSGTLLGYGGVVPSTGTATLAYGTGGQVDSTGYLVYVGYIQPSTTPSTRYVVLTKSDKVNTAFDLMYPIWQRKITLTSTLTSSKLILDSSDNCYFLVNDGTSTNGYLLKYNSSGVLQWQRRLGLTHLTAITIDSSNNIYVAGNNSFNNLFVAKYNSSGVLQWQNRLAGATFTGLGIKLYNSNLYISGATSGKGYIIKLPSDGSIPGDGSYYVGGSTTLTYSVATQTEAAGALVDASNTEYPVDVATNTVTNSLTGTTLSQTNTIISLT